jgi:hypothetical protein
MTKLDHLLLANLNNLVKHFQVRQGAYPREKSVNSDWPLPYAITGQKVLNFLRPQFTND